MSNVLQIPNQSCPRRMTRLYKQMIFQGNAEAWENEEQSWVADVGRQLTLA